MRHARIVSILTLAAFLTAGTAKPVFAGPQAPQPAAPSALRASIDRAAGQAAQFPRTPVRRAGAVSKQMTGGGGGGGMMLMTLIVTAASLAGTYFLVKELKKSNETTTTAP